VALPSWAFAQPKQDYAPYPSARKVTDRLVHRTSYGATREQLDRANQIGFQAYLEEQLAMAPDSGAEIQTYLAGKPWRNWSLSQLRQNENWDLFISFIDATMARKVLSNSQLFERMVEFWSDHFSIHYFRDAVGSSKIADDRDASRPNALGYFGDILFASASSPAMLLYLDNAFSWAGAPNQNYARELLELHTMGVNGGYTQQDVEEVARCFTGWTVDLDSQSASYGEYIYNPDMHDDGEKVVLGVTIPPGGGVNDGETVLQILANHPSTAKFIAKKLLRFFITERPTTAQINAVAAVFQSTQGNIKQVLRAVLTPSNLMASAPKYKRPMHYYASAARAMKFTATKFESVLGVLWETNHIPFNWGPPNGYPDAAGYWANSIVQRMNGCSWMVYGMEGLDINLPYLTGNAANSQHMPGQLNRTLFFGELPTSEYRSLSDHFAGRDWFNEWTVKEAYLLALSLPSFHWY